jgi:3-oxoadipate enol-lactonase
VVGKRRWAATVPSMPTARLNGITMYYEQHGAGEPLLLINGLGADITLLAPLIAWFARSFRVVAFDNRGAGRSDKPEAPYTIGLMAQDTVALMDALSLEQVTVLGISMGGRIALELALSCPDRVGRLVLVSTSAARLGGIRAPALMLHGRRDRSMPVDLAERMHAGIPGSRIELFRGGHMFFLFAERQKFLDQAGRFLAR